VLPAGRRGKSRYRRCDQDADDVDPHRSIIHCAGWDTAPCCYVCWQIGLVPKSSSPCLISRELDAADVTATGDVSGVELKRSRACHKIEDLWNVPRPMRVLLLPPTLVVWALPALDTWKIAKVLATIGASGGRNPIMKINPHIWQRPELQDALTGQDFQVIFDYLTRHEGLSQRQLAKLLGRSQSQISEIIGGRKVQMYGVLVDFAKRLSIPRGSLGVAYCQDLERARGVDDVGEEDDSVERRRLLANGVAAVFGGAVYGIGPVAEFILPARYHANTPARVGIGDVERVRAVTAFSRWLDSHHGGGSCAEILCSQLAGFDRLLNAIVQDRSWNEVTNTSGLASPQVAGSTMHPDG
jgi:transcriptional regulator with XRE-family HTH domain